MPEYGYTKRMHKERQYTGCQCPEDFEHDGKCQNALRTKDSFKCAPCSQGWHHPYPCTEYVPKGFKTLTFQCDRCGWDSAEHVVTEEGRAMVIDSRTRPRTANT